MLVLWNPVVRVENPKYGSGFLALTLFPSFWTIPNYCLTEIPGSFRKST
jgi:hypothetical protein